ncbi:oligosaccharide flippase family protein [Flavobacterium phycosphaerae]|uniref:oligosaccharide flippase family protein n=1 Tax=Flavobacterium phycosphaerae TaxID=2697515 RepID=UPI00138A69FB|nr:oligosaccharide flippase family protein [Flavobacterium phycosphaerae]
MNKKNNTSYRSILKATGVFGMMQVFRTLISIISSKFVAVYLGPVGLGLVSLLNNAVNIITAITNFEFLTIATREVALATNSDDNTALNKTVVMLQKMAVFISLFGALISLLFSKTLSNFTFGTPEKQYWFYLLSFYFIITSLSNARMAVLQGVNKIKTLAICNITAAFFIAIGTIIIYYFLRIEGIIWVMLYSSVVLFAVTIYFTRQYSFKITPFKFKEFYASSSPIFKLGFFMSINLILGQLGNFLIKLYLNADGNSLQILGYYEVSTVILINYLGLIFNAMSYDFFPKLSAISMDNDKVKQLVNNQIEMAVIIVTPAIILMYLLAPVIIKLLYTAEFSNSFLILKLGLFSVILKAIVFPLGYIILVKGDRLLFFKQALLGDILNLILSIVLYRYFGLLGLGLATVFNLVFFGIYVYIVVNRHYDFHFFATSKKLLITNLLLGTFAVLIIYSFQSLYVYVFISLLFILSVLYSLKELNHRINLKEFLQEKINRNEKE